MKSICLTYILTMKSNIQSQFWRFVCGWIVLKFGQQVQKESTFDFELLDTN